MRLIAIWQTVIALAIVLASLRAITVKLSLVPIFKLFACINFRELYQFAKVSVRESFCARKFLCAKVSVRKSFCAQTFLCANVSVRESFCARKFLCAKVSVRESFCARKFLCAKVSVRESFCARKFLCAKVSVRESFCSLSTYSFISLQVYYVSKDFKDLAETKKNSLWYSL